MNTVLAILGIAMLGCIAAFIYCRKKGIFLFEVCPADDVYYDLPINPKSL